MASAIIDNGILFTPPLLTLALHIALHAPSYTTNGNSNVLSKVFGEGHCQEILWNYFLFLTFLMLQLLLFILAFTNGWLIPDPLTLTLTWLLPLRVIIPLSGRNESKKVRGLWKFVSVSLFLLPLGSFFLPLYQRAELQNLNFQVKCAFERKELFVNTCVHFFAFTKLHCWNPNQIIHHTCRMESLTFFNSVKDLPLCRKPADVWVSFPSKAPPSPHSNAWTARPMLWEGRTNSAAWDLFWPWWLLWDFFLEASYSHCLSTCCFCFEGKRPDKDVRFLPNGCQRWTSLLMKRHRTPARLTRWSTRREARGDCLSIAF